MSQAPKTMRDVFLARLAERMRQRQDIALLSADLGSPVLDSIRAEFPRRFINVGIAEQNLVEVATGLALEGYHVFAYAIAAFITMRCFEATRINLGILNQLKPLNVNLVGVGAGFSYDVSGPSHHCIEDLALMRIIPGMQVLSLSCWTQADGVPDHCLAVPGPKYIRMDSKPLPQVYAEGTAFQPVRGFTEVRRGERVCFVATGIAVRNALQAIDTWTGPEPAPGLIDCYNLNHLDEKGLLGLLAPYDSVITVEEGLVGRGGLDGRVLSLLHEAGTTHQIGSIGIRDRYNFELGGRLRLHRIWGMDPGGLTKAARGMLA